MEEKLDSKLIYDGKVVHLYKDRVLLPNNHESIREVIRHQGAVAILAIIDGKVIMERQFRYPFNKDILEIPAGKLEKEESHLDAARRELEEETGYYANKLTYLGALYPSVAYTDEVIYTYLATDLVKKEINLDPDEFLNVEMIDYDEVKKMILSDEIKDAKTIITILRYELLK